MLVFASDLHLTDGSSGGTIEADAFRVFKQRLSDLAYDASKREDDKTFRPVERVHVVLLGDVLDVIRSDKWLTRGEARPWDDVHAPDHVTRVGEITDAILAANALSLEIVKELSEDGVEIYPPPKTEGARREALPIPVDIYYTVGNHDWSYYVRGEEYDAIRARVVDAMGLANDPKEPFPHDVATEESKTAKDVLALFEDHDVFARHGDIFDKSNYIADIGRAGSSLGDVIVIQLVNRFPAEVAQELGDELPDAFVRGLKEIDNVRPLVLIPLWINGLIERYGISDENRRKVEQTWDRLVDDFLEVDFVKAQDRAFRIDTVDLLGAALKLSKGLSFGALGAISRKLAERSAGGGDNYRSDVLTESHYMSQRARYLLYGHSHKPEVVALNRVHRDDGPLEQYYINTGTWRKVHRRAEAEPRSTDFLSHNVMTYAAFYRNGERNDRPFEVWTGALGD